ncbi:CLIP-associating protein 1-like isoform X3 [Biomphalaria glabrata]|uniref:CLIP-associating protein 1-like isoform X3 n=1 Tax=Biomphalaria glabrata TaxID=6526 RepID=A0A9W2YCT8_BIOGL|nr:CLIP-associating protein 1-like isoform X3 [Biomphalaria glabrata]
MSSLDDFIDGVTSQDTKKRLQTHADLIPFLSDPHSSLECQDFNVDQLIEGLAGWVKSSNFKVSLNGLEVLCLMVDRMGENFKPHVTTVLPAVIDRLGDSKDQVRDMAQQLLLKLMMPASTPQYVFDRLGPAFSHKLWHVKEGILLTLQNTINRYGARCLLLSKIVPDICKLLDDPSPQVREAATNALVEIYRHVGEKVRHDLKKIGLSQQRMNVLNSKFEELKLSGNMLPTADVAPSRSSSHNDEPEFDFIKPTSGKPVQRKHSSASSGGPRRISSSTSETKRKRSASAGGSGAVDEELFIKSFEDVSPVKIFSSRDVQEQMMKIKDALNDVNLTWEKRIDHIKLLRSLLMAGAADYDDFFQSLRTLESAFILVVKDLRSQVVREGCVTIAYLSQQLGTKFDHFAESVLPSLMNLIPNSAKVMSTSGIVCIRFIMQFVHTSRLIPIITSNLTSKSNVIRRYSLEFVNQILHSWPTHCLEKHIALLQDAIKRGINDADSEARAHSRKAFWGFADHFKSQADALLLSLDPSKQKMLQGEVSNSSSSSSLNGDIKPRSRSRAASEERSGYGYSPGIAMGVSGMPQRISSSKSDAGDADVDSDIDPKTRKDVNIITPRARTYSNTSNGSSGYYTNHNQYYNTIGHNRHRVASSAGVTLGTPTSAGQSAALLRSSSATDVNNMKTPKPRATLLSAARMAKGSTNSLQIEAIISNSRSNSPSSARRQLAYAKQTPARVDTGLGPKRTRIPGSHSTGTSREASPARSFKGQERRLSGSSKLSSSGRKTPVLSQKTLRQGPEIEDALQDALSKSSRKRYDQYDSDDAASETSSVCSERSHSSYGGRTSEPSTKERTNQKTRGRTRSFTSGYGVTEDMHSILAQLGSSSHLDRKDGLLSLQHLLRSNRSLSRVELKKVSEMFTRMFHDPHSKVFSVFLDTLIELVYLQSGELGDWLHILLPRLLTKAGGEMLGSVANKVQKALDVIRDCFPFDHQFNTLSKFIIDQSQGPNLKVRVSVLNYLHSLIISMDPSDFVNTMDARLAVSKVISWTMEPRNADVRKASQSVLIALFNLNPAEFSLLLSELPKTFQDGATRILHSHIRAANESTSDVLSPRNVASPQGQNRSRPPSRTSQGHPDDFETENLNPEDIFNSIKKTSADIQSLSINSKLEPYDDVKKEFTSQDSGIQDLRMDSPDGLDHKRAFFNYSQKSAGVIGSATTTLPGGFYNKHEADMSREEVGKILCDIREELANQNERVEQRKNAMLCLQNLVDKGCVTKDLLEEHFKSLLSLLLETLGDQNGDVKVLALKCLQKMLQQFPKYFESFAELTILRVLELHKDDTYRDYTVRTDIKVPYAASEVEDTLVQALPPEQNFRILTPIIQKMEYHMACGAIQMMTKVVEKMPKDVLEASLPHLIPGLFKNFEHKESPVRKASCFCLVAIYLRVEEAMRPFMETLNSHRMKLLNLYIKKRKQEEGK